MAGRIRIKRGAQVGVENLVLSEGEMAVALDTGNVYIGTTAGKVHINPKGGTSDQAVKLMNAREVSISGDATSPAVPFDGTQAVELVLTLATMSGLTAGTYTKLTVDAKGRVTAGAALTIEDLPSIPASKVTGLPTKVSQLTNDSAYQTEAQVAAKVSALVASAPEALDTLKELADALGNDPNFAATITTQISGKEALLKNAAEKTSLADADLLAALDSAASSATKKVKFSTLKAALKTYFDALYNKYVHPAYTAKTAGLYKVTVDATGHVSAATAVAKSDITALGIPGQDTVYTLPTASASVLGGVKVGAGLAMASGVLSVGDIDGGTF